MSQPSLSSGAGPEGADFAQGAADSVTASGPVECINFAIGDDQYGVDIMAVREIKEWTGVLNLRGVVLPIVDLRCRFGQGLTDCTPTHIIIIVHVDGRQFGLLADKVLDIVSFDRKDVNPVPSVARSSDAHFLSGLVTVDGAMIALIDLAHLLSDGVGDASSTRPLDA